MLKKLPSIFCDFLVLLLAALVLSGGLPITTLYFDDLVHQKPWLHRLAMTALSASLFLIILFQYQLGKKNKYSISFLMPHIKQLRVSPALGLTSIFFIFTGVMFLGSALRHEAFKSGFDMAIFTQVVWTTLQGDFLYSSIKGGICLLGDHFSPVLAILALPYAFWTNPLCLLLVQAAAAASCIFPIYLIADRLCMHKAWPPLFVVMFVLYLPLRNSIRFDFHPELLVMPLLMWSFYFLLQRRKLMATFFLLLALTGKENVALVSFGIGFYAFAFLKDRKGWGAGWMFFSVIYFFAVTRWIIPQITGEEYFYLKGNFEAWSNLGMEAFIKHLLRLESFVYLVKIFGPLGFLSLFAPGAFVLTLPMLAQNLTARNEMTLSIFFQYTALLTPFVFISAIYGARKINNMKAILSIFFISVLFMGVSEFYVMRQFVREWHPQYELIKNTASGLEGGASLRTHEFLAPHFAHRKELHIYENNHPREGDSAEARKSQWVVLLDNLAVGDVSEHVRDLELKGYSVHNHLDSLWMLQRKVSA